MACSFAKLKRDLLSQKPCKNCQISTSPKTLPRKPTIPIIPNAIRRNALTAPFSPLKKNTTKHSINTLQGNIRADSCHCDRPSDHPDSGTNPINGRVIMEMLGRVRHRSPRCLIMNITERMADAKNSPTLRMATVTARISEAFADVFTLCTFNAPNVQSAFAAASCFRDRRDKRRSWICSMR